MNNLLSKLLGFDPKTMSIRKEVAGGITTFLTMAFILAVNPSMLHDAGMDPGAVFTATAISSMAATLVMALYAKLPFALAPGMGLNAFFVYTVVLTMGYTWQFALTAVLIEGFIFILLTITGLLDEKGQPRNMNKAFMADAVGTVVGATLGTTTVTTYASSSAGVKAGGRCGLTSFVTAICFALSLFFAPVFLAIPSQATAATLVLVGIIMASDVLKLKIDEMIDIIPCFICIMIMPFTYSISEGIMMGLISYVALRLFAGRWKEMNIGMIVLAILFVLKYIFL